MSRLLHRNECGCMMGLQRVPGVEGDRTLCTGEMRPERDTRLDGNFEGWNPNAIYKLADGSRWKLARARSSQSARVRPGVRVWRFEGKFFFEISETGEFAEVLQML